MLVVFSVGVAALIWDYNGAYRKNVEEITRKTYGKGKKTEEKREKRSDEKKVEKKAERKAEKTGKSA